MEARVTMTSPCIIHWFRQDLRLGDNPGLAHAAANGPVLPVYILDDDNAAAHRMGAASRWWLHQSLNGSIARLTGCGVGQGCRTITARYGSRLRCDDGYMEPRL